jgi:hypothetical protein
MIFAQQHPDVFDEISAAAPATKWAELSLAHTLPNKVMHEMG